MPVPTHRRDCTTRLYPTRCQHCGDDVYFFSCTCGSRVFFDLPHPPWDPHERRCYLYYISYLIDQGRRVDYIRSVIEQRALETGEPIPNDAEACLTEIERARGYRKPEIEVVRPGDEERGLVGVVMTYNAGVNFLKRFGYEDNRFGRSLLGDLLKEEYVEIKVREDELNADVLKDFTVFVPKKVAEERGIGHHSKIFAVLELKSIPGRDPIWTARKVELIT